MAEYKFTAALNAADIPAVSRFQQRPVLIGQLDNRLRDPSTNNTTNTENNPQNLPQVIYAENVLPAAEGVSTVGYVNVGGVIPGAGVCNDVYTIRDGDTAHMLAPADGMNYVKQVAENAWVSFPSIGPVPYATVPIFTVAYVNGKTYICYAYTSLARWDVGVGFTDVTGLFVGIVGTTIKAICGAGNYLIALTSDGSVHWSSLTDPLDFTPSVETGAGNQIPLDIRGYTVIPTSISGGFLIHCTENVVAAVYTQNSAAPWIFREVKGSGGIRDASFEDIGNYRIAKESSAGVTYQFGTYGLQAVNLREADNLHAAVTDFLTSQTIETFDTATNLLTVTRNYPMRVKIAFIGNRWLVLSYGAFDVTTMNYAMIYDTVLKRWGKLKVDHTDVFSFYVAGNTARNALYVLQSNGQLRQLEIDQRTGGGDTGVLILGRYQLNRTNQICSQELELEVLNSNDTLTAYVVTNYNGTTLGQVAAMTSYVNSDNYRSFQKQIEGENISFILKGDFSLTTALLTATKGARM